MNAIDKFRIAPQFYSLQDIKLYYDNSLRSIECAYSASENLNYITRFLGKSEKEVREEVLWHAFWVNQKKKFEKRFYG